MPGRLANLIQVVVLAAGPDAFLRAYSPLIIAFFVTEKHVLELVHPGVNKKQGRIVRR